MADDPKGLWTSSSQGLGHSRGFKYTEKLGHGSTVTGAPRYILVILYNKIFHSHVKPWNFHIPSHLCELAQYTLHIWLVKEMG
jgi:hypothetical protein